MEGFLVFVWGKDFDNIFCFLANIWLYRFSILSCVFQAVVLGHQISWHKIDNFPLGPFDPFNTHRICSDCSFIPHVDSLYFTTFLGHSY